MNEFDSNQRMHPSTLDLKKFVSGKLQETRVGEIESHLELCEICCETIAELSEKDALSSAIRKAHRSSSNLDNLLDDSAENRNQESFNGKTSETLEPAGQTFGRFRLLRELGHGGFGIVWLAHDPSLHRDVALKLPRAGSLISRELKARFLREAWAVAALNHPNVAQIYEAGEHDGVCFIASEFCSGSDLANWLEDERQSISPRLAAWIVKEITSAVAHAHSRGVVHRDLKPGNILLDPVEQHLRGTIFEKEFGHTPKVADFGLAKVAQVDQDDTGTRSIIGTAAYMAPEQARGGQTTAASDIYALGALLYRLLTGQPPHAGDSDLETIQLAQNETPIFPSRLQSGIALDLESICMKCLEIEPRHRYANAEELHKDLQRFLNRESIAARRTSSTERLVRWCRRKPWIATVWGLTLLTAIGSLIFSAVVVNQSRLLEIRLQDKQLAEKNAKGSLYDSRFREVRLGRLGTHLGRRFDGLTAAKEAVELLDELQLDHERKLALRNEAIGCLSLVDLCVDSIWTGPQQVGDTTGVAVNKQLTKFAVWDAEGQIEIRSFADNRVMSTIENPGIRVSGRHDWRLHLRFSPNGRYLATCGRKDHLNCRVWDLLDGNKIVIDVPSNSGGNHWNFDFGPDSKQFATSLKAGTFNMFRLPDGEPIDRFGQLQWINDLRFHPHENKIIAVGDRLAIYDSQTGEELLQRKPIGDQQMVRVAWHPNGKRLGIAFDEELRLFDLADFEAPPSSFETTVDDTSETESKSPIPSSETDSLDPADEASHFPDASVLTGHTKDIVSLSWSSTGEFAATASWDGTTCLWNAAKNRLLMKLTGTAIEFNDDDRYLAFGVTGPQIGRWELADGAERRMLHHLGIVNEIQFGLDGRLLMAAGDESVSTWDAVNGDLLDRKSPGPINSIWVPPKHDSLWLCGPNGVFRTKTDISGTDQIRIRLSETSQTQFLQSSAYRLAASSNGRFVAVSETSPSKEQREKKLQILDQESGEVVSLPISNIHRHSLSPDGKLLALSQWYGYHCYVFRTGEQKAFIRFESRTASSQFSPDGDWLVIGDHSQFKVISTDDWKVRHDLARDNSNIDAPVAFNRSGKLAALVMGRNRVRLVDTNDWSELATFDSQTENRIVHLAISPAGDRLAVAIEDGKVCLWDLRKIRDGLKSLSLDWNADELLPPSDWQKASKVQISAE